jgi:thiol-disulfide isomerase/thioredoxin
MGESSTLPDGFVAVVRRGCPTCVLVAPALAELVERGLPLTVYTQDDTSFPQPAEWVVDDTSLAVSWHHGIQTVPTLLAVRAGAEVERVEGWSRPEWEALTGIDALATDLPEHRPGSGSGGRP